MVCAMQKRISRKQPRPAPTDQRVSRADWIRHGLAVLAEEGIDAVRVEPLAVRLGVTKGSFYWHFADRATLHAAMLESWRQRATRNIAARTSAIAAGPKQQLHHLLSLIATSGAAARLETAIRSWASADTKAARLVAEVDKERTEFVVNLLVSVGIARPTAQLRARMMYLLLIGSYFSHSRGQVLATRELWDEVERLVLLDLEG